MTFEPKQKNKVPEVTVAALFVCAAVALAFSSIELIPGKGVLQSLAFILLGATLFVFLRYKMTFFKYSIVVADSRPKRSLHHEDDDEAVPAEGELSYEDALSMPITAVPPKMLEFRVERRQGKGAYTTECLLKLTDIERCIALPEEKDLHEKLLSENRRVGKYKYFRNMQNPDQIVLLASAPSGKVIVYLERDSKFFEYLRAVAAYNREENDKE